ncbi:MAG: VIT1/CCC1 transporter family protein [Niabella sp.]
MNRKHKQAYNFLPAFVVGATEAIIIILAMFCFLLGKGVDRLPVFLYSSIAIIFIGTLLALGAYYTRKEELKNGTNESKILKIYQALDIDDHLKKAMIADTLQENEVWEKEWQHAGNATSSLSPKSYALSMFSGFATGGIIVLLNNLLMQLPDYKALFLPFVLLSVLGYLKYKLSGRKPLTGLLLIAVTGMAAAFGAYYIGSLF